MKTTSKKTLLSNDDLDNISGRLEQSLDTRLAPLATKQDLKIEAEGLKSYIHEGIETVMEGIEKITEQLAEKERVERLETWARKVSEKIGVKLEI